MAEGVGFKPTPSVYFIFKLQYLIANHFPVRATLGIVPFPEPFQGFRPQVSVLRRGPRIFVPQEALDDLMVHPGIDGLRSTGMAGALVTVNINPSLFCGSPSNLRKHPGHFSLVRILPTMQRI